MSTLLQAADLAFAYRAAAVLRGASLSLCSGQILALLGPNGCGKSTLIRVLLGHLRAAGTVRWEGRPIGSWKRRELARRVAYLPQSPACQPYQTVLDVLRLGRAPYWGPFGVESRRDAQVVHDVAAGLGLTDLLGRQMDELSGGQKQRVFIARCLAQEPAAMLLDEPSTFLDLRYQVELGQLLRRLATDRGIGILLASHEINLAAAVADQLAVLSEGRIVLAGAPREVLDPDRLGQVYQVALEQIPRPGGWPLIVPRGQS